MQSGFLLINKPADWTSHDVVGYLRKVTGVKKIGHAGTLDPFATGLLIVGIGRDATKRLDEFKAQGKIYRAGLRLGVVSDTYDATGAIAPVSEEQPSRAQVEKTIQTFIGPQEQLPPMFSAKKVGGKKLYELARKGETIERASHHIVIDAITILDYTYPLLSLEITCSPGTYIRTLGHDIGQSLGTGALVETLERTAIGPYTVTEAHDPRELTKETAEQFLFLP